MSTPNTFTPLLPTDRKHWGGMASAVPEWTALGCERVPGAPIARLGESVTRLCHARGHDRESGVVVTLLYAEGWRLADVESYRF